MDWNDLALESGEDAVRQQLLAGLDEPEAPAQPEPPPPDAHKWKQALQRNKEGAIKPIISNISTILHNDPRWAGVLAYCEFSYRLMKLKPPPFPSAESGEWSDVDTYRLRIWMSQHYRFSAGDGDALGAAVVMARAHSFHPVRDYLDGLEWDGTHRLDHWLRMILGSRQDIDYLAVAGRKFMVGAVARIFRPGCKMDNVLIFEGEQGKRKSSAIGVLFGAWYSDAPIVLGDKDAYQQIQGCWGVELAELDAFNKAESTAAKSFFSQVRDRYRPSYGRCVEDFPRQCVFIGSTNQQEYLKDQTGNRRYWPIRTHAINIDLLAERRDQLWAEAVHRFRQEEPWWVEANEQELFQQEQEARMQADGWEDPIRDYLDTITKDKVTATEIMEEAIKMPRHQVTKAHTMRIAPIMLGLGWQPTRWRDHKGTQVRGYQCPKTGQEG
jgi:putative DNA primase/helicase